MMISPHFSDTEFGIDSTNQVNIIIPPDPDLLAGLEYIRTKLNRPVLITSGYRSPEKNEMVGGAERSMHMTNPLQAVDIVVPGVHVIDLAAVALEYPAFKSGGVGIYPNDGHVHVDVRKSGPARWIG